MRASYITPGITIFCGIGPCEAEADWPPPVGVKHVKKKTLYSILKTVAARSVHETWDNYLNRSSAVRTPV